jgi:hypothetical protein
MRNSRTPNTPKPSCTSCVAISLSLRFQQAVALISKQHACGAAPDNVVASVQEKPTCWQYPRTTCQVAQDSKLQLIQATHLGGVFLQGLSNGTDFTIPFHVNRYVTPRKPVYVCTALSTWSCGKSPGATHGICRQELPHECRPHLKIRPSCIRLYIFLTRQSRIGTTASSWGRLSESLGLADAVNAQERSIYTVLMQ